MTKDVKKYYSFTPSGVALYTASGPVKASKRNPSTKFIMGWLDSGAFSGRETLSRAWNTYKAGKPDGCSWYAYGFLAGAFCSSTHRK